MTKMANQEENDLVKLFQVPQSFRRRESLGVSDDVIPLDVSCSVIPPPHTLTSETKMANQEENDLVLDLFQVPQLSRRRESLGVSDDVISLDDSCSVIPPPHTLTSETNADNLVAEDFVLVDGHVNEDDDGPGGVVVRNRVIADYRGSSFLGGGSRYSVKDCTNRDADADEDHDYDYNDLDDELVPRSESKKLKRDRMNKLGKRCSSYLQLKRGCVHGKHGFGIKFRC